MPIFGTKLIVVRFARRSHLFYFILFIYFFFFCGGNPLPPQKEGNKSHLAAVAYPLLCMQSNGHSDHFVDNNEAKRKPERQNARMPECQKKK